MTDIDRKMFKGVIDTRLNIAYGNFQNKPEYVECCEQQEKSQKVIDDILNKLDESDRLTVCYHYEGETARESIEIFEYYLQGLRDGVKLLIFLDAFHPEMI